MSQARYKWSKNTTASGEKKWLDDIAAARNAKNVQRTQWLLESKNAQTRQHLPKGRNV